jgi:3-methylcrotonyl-CoA carboxylase alpha subunit
LAALVAVDADAEAEAARLGVLMLIDDEWERLNARRFSPNGIEGQASPWENRDGFQLSGLRTHGLPVVVEGVRQEMTVTWDDKGPTVSFAGGSSRFTHEHSHRDRAHFPPTNTGRIALRNGRQTRVDLYDPFAVDLEHMDEGGLVKAPMHGKVVAVLVRPGDRVQKGQRLAIVEAMKMEHVLVAPSDGEVAEVAAEAGAQVAEGARLIVLKAGDE